MTTLEDEPKQFRRIMEDHKISESVEVEKPAKEQTTAMQVCGWQSRADTVAAGVTFAEETNEDETPWRDPDTGLHLGASRPLGDR